MGRALRARIRTVFDQDRVVGLYEALYASVDPPPIGLLPVDPPPLDPPARRSSESPLEDGPAEEIGRIPWPA
jgi:hypothetical protein